MTTCNLDFSVMTKEEQVFLKHLSDLQEAAWNRNIVTFSDFCGLNELNIFYSSRADFSAPAPKADDDGFLQVELDSLDGELPFI